MKPINGESGKKFEELKSKIAQAIEINPDAKYLILIKKGAMSDHDLVLFQNLWREILKTGMVQLVLVDPERDIKVLEITQK